MALTNCQKGLIRSIADNNMKSARQWAIHCLNEDGTQKNAQFVEQYKSVLEQQENKLIELPSSISGFIRVENISETFNANRYFLSDSERLVSEKIMRMSMAAAKLSEMKISYLNSTLLYGESGTGKTTFGRYVAYKSKRPFCYLNFSTLIDSYMGNSSKNIAKAFEFVALNSCVFMIDELDAISINRAGSKGGGAEEEMSRVTITIMQELDRLPNDVILLAATNRIDRIDEAVLRRFSVKHEVKALNDDEKLQLLDVFLSDVGVDFSGERILEILSRGRNRSEIIARAVEEIAADILDKIKDGESDG